MRCMGRVVHGGLDALGSQGLAKLLALRHPHRIKVIAVLHLGRASDSLDTRIECVFVTRRQRAPPVLVRSRWRSFTRRIAACSSSSRALIPSIRAWRRRQPVQPDPAHPLGQLGIARETQAPVAEGAEVLGGVEREGRDVAERAGRRPPRARRRPERNPRRSAPAVAERGTHGLRRRRCRTGARASRRACAP